MPIYEYECVDCKRRREILHKTRPATETDTCDICGGVMNKLMSVTSEPIVHGFSEKNSYSHTKDVKKKKDK